VYRTIWTVDVPNVRPVDPDPDSAGPTRLTDAANGSIRGLLPDLLPDRRLLSRPPLYGHRLPSSAVVHSKTCFWLRHPRAETGIAGRGRSYCTRSLNISDCFLTQFFNTGTLAFA
jgi:hypothetical protein